LNLGHQSNLCIIAGLLSSFNDTEHKLDVRLVIHSKRGRWSCTCPNQIEIPAYCTQYIPLFRSG